MTGYNLMTNEQQREWMDLEERCTHSDSMRFTPLDACHLSEYRALARRLESECLIDQKVF